MMSRERVLEACRFRRPDRVPRFDQFWVYPDEWREKLGDPVCLTDIDIWVPDEGAFPTRARRLKEEGGWIYDVDSWGRTSRRREGAYFSETLDVPLPAGCDIDAVAFDPPGLDLRYERMTAKLDGTSPEAAAAGHCAFGKTGGPYLRSTYVRGEEQFLMDMAGDPPLARAIADKMADHLTGIALEELRRWPLQDTGVWIYDDMAGNLGPVFSPKTFEDVLLPAYRRMIRAYKDAGAKYVFLHSDGDVRPILDMLIDAGIDGLHPLERRAGMDMTELRESFPKLVLVGGMCNTETLRNGPASKIEDEARAIIELGRDGGVIIGTHSISPEIPLDHLVTYDTFVREHGAYCA